MKRPLSPIRNRRFKIQVHAQKCEIQSRIRVSIPELFQLPVYFAPATQIREGWMEMILLNIRPAICHRQATNAAL